MDVIYSYGRARLAVDPKHVSWRPAELVDLLMGLRPEPGYVGRLLLYPAEEIAWLWSERGQPDISAKELEQTGRWFREWLALPKDLAPDFDHLFIGEPSPRLKRALTQLRDRFLAAGEAATDGRSVLAEELTRVTFIDERTVDIPDVVAFGAWCLQKLLDKGPVTLATCEMCGSPWLPGRKDPRFCSRPAPGRRPSCREVAAQEHYQQTHADYSRERRRLGQLARRGRLDRRTYEEWKTQNSPGVQGNDWLLFDEWLETKGGSTNG